MIIKEFETNGIIECPELLAQEKELRLFCENKGFKFYLVDGEAVYTKEQLLREFFDTCEFPDYFGFNWDALEECLRDYSFAPAKGYIFGLLGSVKLKTRLEKELKLLQEIFEEAAKVWENDGVLFVLLLG